MRKHWIQKLGIGILFILPTVQTNAQSITEKPYWNLHTHLMPLRLPPAPTGYIPTYIDLNKDGKLDGIKSITHKDVPILWLDDDGNLKKDDLEGDMVNDCLLIDRNKDGVYGGCGDLIIDWVDEDGDGKADMQIVLDYPAEEKKDGAHYMIVRDLDRDNVFNYINWNNFTLQCWDRNGLSDFYEDYSGRTMFMKIHTASQDMKDLRLNWENPFLFYDPDEDGMTEMAIRLVDSPKRNKEDKAAGWEGPQLTGKVDWVSLAVDLDNDNTTGNEFDFDFTIGFQGEGFDYMDQVHPVKNLRGLPEADRFFMDARYRQMTELIYPDHESAPDLIFNRGKWNRINFTYDEDDDNGRWERVEFYEPRDPFKSGWKNGGVDNHKQSDAAGDRGEWDMDNSGEAKLYLSRFDGRMHLYDAETGVWRIDQNATYYEGWDRMWMGQEYYPKSFATVTYADKDNNGFFDHIEYDLDGDTRMETVIDFKELGIDDVCELIDVSQFSYKDYTELGKRMSEGIWKRAQEAVQIARQHGVQTAWYAKWMSARTLREKYNHGYWLAFYIYKDLENHFVRLQDAERLKELHRAYYSGDWSLIAKKGADGFYFFSEEDKAAIRASAGTRWGKKIVAQLDRLVKERRKHPLAVPEGEGGHYHDYFCPKHNLLFSFRWDKPLAHYCSACDKEWIGNNRYDWAWIYQVHMFNLDYMYQSMYLYLATGKRKFADYIKEMLMDYAGKYNGWFEHNVDRKPSTFVTGKAFAQSLNEANWATKAAMAYQVIKPLLTKEEIDRIEDGYLKPAANLLLHRPAEANWQMWHNSGLAALGIALENDSIIDVAIHKKGYGYHHLIDKHKNSDGWINEGSPHYHYYPLEALLFTANAVKCRGIRLFDTDLHDMFVEPIKGTYPDLSFPAHSDGWYGANLLSQSALYEMANVRFDDPLLNEVLERTYAKKERLDAEALLSGKEIRPLPDKMIQNSYSFDESGFAMLRSDARTVVLKFGGEGIGHGHPDKLSITIHDGEEELVSDFGTSGYGVSDYLKWYKRSLSHNTVVVDAKDQKRSKGKLLAFIPRNDGGYAEAETTTAYPGVRMKRSLDLKANNLTDVYTCTSDSLHLYEYIILFNEKPQIVGEGKAITLKDSEVHERIRDAFSYSCSSDLSCRISSADVRFRITEGEVQEVIVGEASGIPSNPTVKDGPAVGDVAVKPCYPLIIRVKGKDMSVNADWKLMK
ncbi:MAG: heparinase II/III family protein [Bacteroides sp.]|nr:heparinase II/III family protein [Bacteroides sp.]